MSIYFYRFTIIFNRVRIKAKSKGGAVMPQIRPITDLRNTNAEYKRY